MLKLLGLEGAALYLCVGLLAALLLSWAGAGLAIKYLDGKLEGANRRAGEAATARAAEEQSRIGFQAAAGSCSASVAKLAASGAARDKLWETQLAGSSARAKSAEAQAAAILARGRPAGLNECQAMLKELDDEIARRAAKP